jgi:hypothetical protein
MDHSIGHNFELDGELIAVLLDQDEYPSNIGNVVAVSDRQICFLKRDVHELLHYRFEFYDMDDCKAIEYRDQMVYYRVVVAVVGFVLTAVLAFMLLTGSDGGAQDFRALVIGLIALLTIGIRFITSTHRHVINFEMPDEVLSWRSPAIDYREKAEAAHAIREYARKRGILRDPRT